MLALPAGVAYAVWTGIGSIGVSAVGVIWFKERFQPPQLISFALSSPGSSACVLRLNHKIRAYTAVYALAVKRLDVFEDEAAAG